jgi:hypothetical protein
VNACFAAVTDWIATTSKERKADPPKPEELMDNTGLRSNVAQCTEFADRMIRAVYGKTRYNPGSSTTLFDELISPSQEAFALLLYKNGYDNWVWMHNNACLTSEGSDTTVGGVGTEDEGCPRYKHTKRTGDFTSRNGGWTREGMNLYNEMCRKVKEDRQTNDGAFGKVHREHRACLCGRKRKRRTDDGAGQQQQLAICDDLDQLWTAAATEITGV